MKGVPAGIKLVLTQEPARAEIGMKSVCIECYNQYTAPTHPNQISGD